MFEFLCSFPSVYVLSTAACSVSDPYTFDASTKEVSSLYCSLVLSLHTGVERTMLRHCTVLFTQEKKRSGLGTAMVKQSGDVEPEGEQQSVDSKNKKYLLMLECSWQSTLLEFLLFANKEE